MLLTGATGFIGLFTSARGWVKDDGDILCRSITVCIPL